jgi:hypothetical protein
MKQKEEFITEEKVINTPAGGVLIGKEKEGQTIIHNDGSLGGFLIGRLHKDGGIKAVNKATGQPLEMQSNEIIITAPAVADTTKRNFEGKMMTNREILSKINSDGGGVSFADGGDIPAKIHTTDKEYEYGGKMVHDTDIAHNLGMNSTLKKGKQQFYSGGMTYDVDAIYNAIKKGKLRLKTKEVQTFPMKYPVYDKEYSETVKTDFRKPNGITVRTESGEEVLIDGNHRMNNAYLKGKKTMKTYYIEDPKQIARFSKKSKFELGGNATAFDRAKLKQGDLLVDDDNLDFHNKIYKILKIDNQQFEISVFENYKNKDSYLLPIKYLKEFKLANEEEVDFYNENVNRNNDSYKNGGHLSKGKSLKQIAEMHNVSLAHINKELTKGLEVEKEHFTDFKERTRVAKDHLVENPNYYTLLSKAGLKRGGHIPKQDLVENSKKGDSPARDLNNYNDIMDLEADGAVGGDSGIFADGGLTPYDANQEGDSVPVLSTGGGLGLPKVAYVKVSNAGSSLYNSLVGNKYNSYIEFADSVKEAYKPFFNKKPIVRSFVSLEAYDENNTKLLEVNTSISDQKNTVKNFNPQTGNYKNLEKSLQNSRPRSFQKYDWEDWFLSRVKPSTASSTSSNASSTTGNASSTTQTPTSTASNSAGEIVEAVNVEFTYPDGRIEVSTTINISSLKNALANFWNLVDKKSWEVRITPFENPYKSFDEKKLIIGNDFAEFNPETFSEEQLGNKLKSLYPDLDWSIFIREKNSANNSVSTAQTPASTSVKPFDFTDTKINVKGNPDLSLKVQKKAFENGWEWENGIGKAIDYSTINYLYFTKKSISDGFTSSSFNNSPKREITEAEIFGAQTPTSTSASTSPTSTKTPLTKEQLFNSRIWIGDDVNLKKKVIEKLEEIGIPLDKFNGNSNAEESIDINIFAYDFVVYKESKEEFNKDTIRKEIFPEDLGIDLSASQTFDLSKTKIKVGADRNLSKKIQEKAFELGWGWGSEILKDVQSTGADSLFFNENKQIEAYYSEASFKEAVDFREITEAEIFGFNTTTAQYKPINLSQTKIWIGDDEDVNSQIQERAFELGWSWKTYPAPKGLNYTFKPALYFDKYNDISYGDDRQLFDSNKDFREITFKELFDKIESNLSGVQTPTTNTASTSDKKIKDLKEAVDFLEGIASEASKKYNTEQYEESLELLKEVKEEYALALSFTPESSFMYERIELLKKITEIQKEITKITELKSGGAFYILSKVIDRLEKGENWKELGNGEIIVNEVPQQEIDTVIYTEKFKNWFGNWEQALITKEYDYVSKAITESGKPCVMYHGAKRIKYSYRQVSNGVVYLAENRSYAEWFSATDSPYQKEGDYLTQCFVNLKNPIDLTPFGVDEVDLRDIIQYIDALYPLAKIYDVLPPNTAMAIMNNQLIGRNFRAWYIIRQFPELNKHIRDNTSYDGFIYYENNPSDMIIGKSGELEQNVTKATAVFNSNQVKLVDAMLFDGSLDDWRFETGGKVN